MLNRPVVHELDSNAIYLRSLEINLHHKKLNAIRHRKNQFESEQSTTRYYKRYVKFKDQAERSTPYYGFHNCLAIKRDNKKLAEKLLDIQTRANKKVLDDQTTKVIKTRNKFYKSIRMLKAKQLSEDNRDFGKRLMNRSGYINVKKMENDFVLHQKFFNQLRRIKPRNKSCEDLTSEFNYNLTMNKTEQKKHNKISIGSNFYITNQSSNNRRLVKNNSMGSLPSL